MFSASWIRSIVAGTALMFVPWMNLVAQRYTFRQYGPTEGLTNLAINSLLQDRTGYIWVGTDNGLFRYDGTQFVGFGHANGLPNTEILELAESPEGVLWVATQSGVARLSGNHFEKVDIGEAGGVRGVAFDSKGHIYLRHLAGLIRGTPDGKGSYRFQMVVQGDIRGLLVDGDDVWFGKDRDLWRLTGNDVQPIGLHAGLPSEVWDAIVKDSENNLWVRSATRLYEFPHGQSQFVDRSEGVPTAPDPRLYVDSHRRVFLPSDSGVLVLDGDSRTHIDIQHGLPAEAVGPVLVDRRESLWLGLIGNGLARRLGNGEWLSWKKEDGLLHNSVWAILHDDVGRLWVGSSGGLNLFDRGGKPIHSWTSRNGLAGNRVQSIVEDSFGSIYAGTDPGGVSHFSKTGAFLQTYGSKNGLALNRVISLAFDRQQQLWVAGARGCYHSQALTSENTSPQFVHIEIPGMPPDAAYYAVLVDEAGTLWMSTSNGLVRFDGTRWKVFNERDGLKSADLGAIAARQGMVWISYRDALGISRLKFDGDRVEATHITQKDGLYSDQVYALAFDTAGWLWATTDYGVDVLERDRWQHYGKDEGLVWDDANGYAILAEHNGDVWIGTSGGLSRYSPPPYKIPASPPPVVLTTIEGVARQFQAGDQPVLAYSERSLTIRYTALSFESGSHVHFRYRLTGYENAWTETTERNVHFAGLPVGHYVFEVIAQGPNGLWSPVPTQFAFSVRPPWWQSWWLITGCILLTLLLGRLVWRLRVRSLMAQTERLEQQVAKRTAELRESHRRLSESKQQLWAAMDAAKLGIWSQELANGERSGESRRELILGASPAEPLRFEDLLESVVSEDRERFENILTRAPQKRNGGGPVLERQVRMPDGSIRWLQVRGGLIRDDAGRSMRAAGVVMDVTEQRQAEQELQTLEQQLRQAQKIEAIGRLAGGIAHDFNNLLMVIQSYTEILRDKLPAQDSLRASTQEILKAAERGAGLTRQLLAFSRKQVLAPVILDLNALVNDAAKMLKRLIGEDVEMRVREATSLWTVKADPHQIVQVLVNLCVNSRDAMPQGGTLTISTENLTVDERSLDKHPYVAPGSYVLLSVCDTGSGISKEVQERMFEPFFTTKEGGKGTGLGLSTVFGVVQQSGGHIWVDSEPGKGACFTVCLPKAEGTVRTENLATPEVGQKGAETILIAEDEESLQEAIGRYLSSMGYTVLSASSGPQALAVAEGYAGTIDLLITDVVMPKMSGRELAKALEQVRPKLKTIYMSGYTDDAVVRYSVSEEGVVFLQKPFSLSTLARKVREMMKPREASH
jgi:PAS domain S-box-containing protein